MTRQDYAAAWAYVEVQLGSGAHDIAHVQRVLNHALGLLVAEPMADPDVVILAALLHDVGRGAEGAALPGPHAATGAALAHAFLQRTGWGDATAARVRDCIATHSYRGGPGEVPPQSLEAKILFDADKLDMAGALGLVRLAVAGAEAGEPLYTLGPGGLPLPGKKGEAPSLFRDCRRQLRKLHRRFFTGEARRLAQKRRKTMDAFFAALQSEAAGGYRKGGALLGRYLDE